MKKLSLMKTLLIPLFPCLMLCLSACSLELHTNDSPSVNPKPATQHQADADNSTTDNKPAVPTDSSEPDSSKKKGTDANSGTDASPKNNAPGTDSTQDSSTAPTTSPTQNSAPDSTDTSSDDITQYHAAITDVSAIPVTLDLSDSRLAELMTALKTEKYNLHTGRIREIGQPASLYVLANKLNHLPADYIPEDLTVPTVRFPYQENLPKRQLRQVAADGLSQMFAAADADGLTLYAVSGYRSYDRQSAIYSNNVKTRGQAATDKISSRPGHSEHQTGLAMDISCSAVDYRLQTKFGQTAEGIWVANNAHQYGFIIRYPEDKVDITGYDYEPWHLRYVGTDVASFLHDHAITLEELYSNIYQSL